MDHATAEEVKRLFDVFAERLHADIRLMIEGVARNNAALDRIEKRLDRIEVRLDRMTKKVFLVQKELC